MSAIKGGKWSKILTSNTDVELVAEGENLQELLKIMLDEQKSITCDPSGATSALHIAYEMNQYDMGDIST